MDATLWVGNSGTQTITTPTSFKPDFVWLKDRTTGGRDPRNLDTVRGATKSLLSSAAIAELTEATGLTAFTSTGFTLGSENAYNGSADNYVGWCWQAGQGTNTTNTTGSITSTVSVNTTAGFSIATYTGNGTSGASIGHGLGTTPAMVFLKTIGGTGNWVVYHQGLSSPTNTYLVLNVTDAASTASGFCTPSSSTITFTTAYAGNNPSGVTMVAYSWAQVAGFSSFGSYVGNGSADGPFVYTGFRPKFVMIKAISGTLDWEINDSSRNPYNASNLVLYPNLSAAETSTYGYKDLLSNGFKIRTTNANSNTNGTTYIYAAFAENPFKYANAR
jgi:hypothetical protein